MNGYQKMTIYFFIFYILLYINRKQLTEINGIVIFQTSVLTSRNNWILKNERLVVTIASLKMEFTDLYVEEL